MLDMGFIRDIKRILALLPKQRQNLLFSATFSDEIKELADGLLERAGDDRGRAAATRRSRSSRRRVHPVDRDRKRELLVAPHQAATTGTRCWCSRAPSTAPTSSPSSSTSDGITALAIHGNKSQGARTRALAEFKDGSLQVLVATDIAARGIDIDQLPHVVNYDLPNVPEDYVHRIGRTGRAGASGEAISLVCVDEHEFLRDIEKLIKRTLPRDVDRRLRAGSRTRGPSRSCSGRAAAGPARRRAALPAAAAAAAPGRPRQRRRMPRRTGLAPRRRRAARRARRAPGRPRGHGAATLGQAGRTRAPATAPAPRSPLAAQHRPVNRGR